MELVRLDRVTRLDQLRRARSSSQVQLAEQLGTNQGALSRLEHQTDLCVSTLRRFVHALGGELQIVAQFDDAEPIDLDLFGDLAHE
ncbi:MAG: helix-turn-helix domain-containing protein [Vulcanimicrobiaceae bacterium]